MASYPKLFSIREEALAHAVEKNVEADAFTFLAVRPNDDVASSNRSIKDATYFNPRCHSWPIASFDRLRSKRMPRPQILVLHGRSSRRGSAHSPGAVIHGVLSHLKRPISPCQVEYVRAYGGAWSDAPGMHRAVAGPPGTLTFRHERDARRERDAAPVRAASSLPTLLVVRSGTWPPL
jgi:hypothetical protein